MVGQATVCGVAVIAVTITDSIRSNGITYRCITDYIYYILLNHCMTPQ